FGGGPQPRRRSRRQAGQPGANVQSEVEVPFDTAVIGGEVNLRAAGAGRKTETITVKIPAGIENGKTLRLRGQGEPSTTGGPAGDLLSTARADSPSRFLRTHLYL